MNPWETRMSPAVAPPPAAPAVGPDFGAKLGSLIRGLSALAAATTLDRQTDPRRVLPAVAPAALWRTWPRVLDLAGELAAALPVPPVTAGEVEFMHQLADTIEIGGPAPVVALPAEPEGVAGE